MRRAMTPFPQRGPRSGDGCGVGSDPAGVPAPWPAADPPADLEALRRFRALLERARTGDGEAFTALFEAHRPRLLRVAQAILHDPMASEDAVQEGWIKAWQAVERSQFGLPAQFGAWLGIIVGRLAIDLLRRRRTQLALDALAGRLRDDGDVADQATDQALLEAILAGLRPVDRRLLELIRDDHAREEILTILSAEVDRPLTPAWLRQRLWRALRAARRQAQRPAPARPTTSVAR
ncbi:MAG: sigma-70 family RNA polymerase sigma factor [Chloroflexi bacterium]|nr:sigma-70 family RNA polymerase sigma factor [Chloroflexota bacterium]